MSLFGFLLYLFCSLCFCVSGLLPNVDGNAESCQTPKLKVGQCIEIEKCPSMYSLSQQKPLSEENRFFLILSGCGDGEPKVCCDVDDHQIELESEKPANYRNLGNWANADPDNCVTVERQEGYCVLIGLCPPLLGLIKPRPFTTEKLNYLRQANCGYEGIVPKVCCPVDEVQFTKMDPIGSSTSPLLPSTNICGPLSSNRIKGGKVAELGEFPWMALLEYSTPTGSQFSCGGSLINNKYVLTAAHCVKGKDVPRDWSLVSVRLGEHDISSLKDCDGDFCAGLAIDVEIAEQIVHETYAPYSISQHHDIALLRLAREVSFTDFVTPICIPTNTDLLSKTYAGINMTVAGWGLTENDTSSDVLRKLEVTVKSTDECVRVYGSRVSIHSGQLCAGGDKDRDSCLGDSGGPLMVQEGVNLYVAGIVSFGPTKCGLDKWPGIYIRLSYYVQWILDNLKP